MTSQNQSEKDAKPPTYSKYDSAPKPAKSTETKPELTDDEIAAIAGGCCFCKTDKGQLY
jgi:hypothetical protein